MCRHTDVSVELVYHREEVLSCVIVTNGRDCALPVVHVQHKKLSVEGGGISKDFRKGLKQGDLEIWDPVDKVLVEGSNGYGKVPGTPLTPRTCVNLHFLTQGSLVLICFTSHLGPVSQHKFSCFVIKLVINN